ncbi:exonuclease domain-containing protein [Thalassospira marina]|uniref:DNA-directed DNA polymerase n=1 Tax=Thalassospira marina TaxID=2048283 RepID=A0A2N3KWQ5_9PROT|nr:exonuclease domain-containing protein [Thalassospira marina]PKR54994.1 DNA polymerase III subunit epsilon [Thalassospira marina]
MGLHEKITDSQLYRRWIKKRAQGPLAQFYGITPVAPERRVSDIEFVAVDLETTGLNAKHDEIISIGWVLIRNRGVDFSSAHHSLVRPTRDVSESSAVIHGILDSHVAEAPDIDTILRQLLPILAGRVLLAHHAPIELGFLGRACKRLYGAPLQMPTVDTLVLGLRDIHRQGTPLKSGALKLQNLRKTHNLPPYRAHNALTDAIATAELFLAQINKRDPKGELELDRVLR